MQSMTRFCAGFKRDSCSINTGINTYLIDHASKSKSLSGVGVNHLALQYITMPIKVNETEKILKKTKTSISYRWIRFNWLGMNAFRRETSRRSQDY